MNFTAPQVGLSGNWLTRMNANHPFLTSLGANILGLGPALGAYNLYNSFTNNSALHNLGNDISGLFSHSGTPSGGFNASGVNDALNGLSGMGMGSGAPGGGMAPGSIGGGMPFGGGGSPSYGGFVGTPSVSGESYTPLGNYPQPASYQAPVGGYWNQQAIRDAAPAYGPYAGLAALGGQ